ncbi:MAG: SLBB domain-containing protein [bacterium]
MSLRSLPSGLSATLFLFLVVCLLPTGWRECPAQEVSPEMLDEAARRSGMSQDELQRRYEQRQAQAGVDSLAQTEPGRTSLAGINDSIPGGATPLVVLPYSVRDLANAEMVLVPGADPGESSDQELQHFGADFFRLDPGVFNPTTFGPVPDDYLIGVGDQIVVDVWGEVEFRLERVVDRDGAIILPRGGKISCNNRTLGQVERTIREQLARSYSGISGAGAEVTTFVDVSLGRLRAIRVYVVGEALQPGAYELSSVATVFTALYAAGGPAETGSMRNINLVRGKRVVAHLDLYDYLLAGKREDDIILREGDTIFIPVRGATVSLTGAVRRSRYFELKSGEGLTELLRFGGGFTTIAATEMVQVERIVPPEERQPQQPDRIVLDIPLDAESGLPTAARQNDLFDGDNIRVGRITERLENWVEIVGNVKRPGRYELQDDMDVAQLITRAGGLWSDTLQERAIIDRHASDGTYQAINFALGAVMADETDPVSLQPQDIVRIFSKWDIQDRHEVSISGAVRSAGHFPYREGLTLRDLILKAGGLRESADLLRAEVSRLRMDALQSHDTDRSPSQLVNVIEIPLGDNYLTDQESFLLKPHDQVAIRKLPWWELQRKVTIRGEVYYPGVYALEWPDERLSEVILRAGGLKPTAYAPGARILREQDQVGNIAIELDKALNRPGTQYDVLLAEGDEITVPELQHTVKVVGAVGFPTSIVFQRGKSLGDYIDRAGGYAESADKWKTRVVYANGLSRPIKKVWRDPRIMPGSTIVVPVKPPSDGSSNLETLKEIAAIFASVATVWLVIDRTN